MEFRSLFKKTEQVQIEEFDFTTNRLMPLNEASGKKITVLAYDNDSITLAIGKSQYVYRGLSPFLINKFETMLKKYKAGFNALHWLHTVVPVTQRFKVDGGQEVEVKSKAKSYKDMDNTTLLTYSRRLPHNSTLRNEVQIELGYRGLLKPQQVKLETPKDVQEAQIEKEQEHMSVNEKTDFPNDPSFGSAIRAKGLAARKPGLPAEDPDQEEIKDIEKSWNADNKNVPNESKVNEDDMMNGGATTASDKAAVSATVADPKMKPKEDDESTHDAVTDDAGTEESEESKEGEKEYLGNNGSDQYFYLYKKPAEGVDESNEASEQNCKKCNKSINKHDAKENNGYCDHCYTLENVEESKNSPARARTREEFNKEHKKNQAKAKKLFGKPVEELSPEQFRKVMGIKESTTHITPVILEKMLRLAEKYTTSSDTSGQPADAKAAAEDVRKSAAHEKAQTGLGQVKEIANYDKNKEEDQIVDLQILDAEDEVVYSAKKVGIDVNDVKTFIMDALKELAIANISYDIVLDYLIPDEEPAPAAEETETPEPEGMNAAQGEPEMSHAGKNESLDHSLLKKFGLIEDRVYEMSDEALMLKYGFMSANTAVLFEKFGLIIDEANIKEVENLSTPATTGVPDRGTTLETSLKNPMAGKAPGMVETPGQSMNITNENNAIDVRVASLQRIEEELKSCTDESRREQLKMMAQVFDSEIKELKRDPRTANEGTEPTGDEDEKKDKKILTYVDDEGNLHHVPARESKVNEDGEILPDPATTIPSGTEVPDGTDPTSGPPPMPNDASEVDPDDIAADYSTPEAARNQIKIDYPEEPLMTTALVFADSFINDPAVYKDIRKMSWEGLYTDAEGIIAQSKVVGDYRSFTPEAIKLLTDRLGNGAKYKLGRNNGPTVTMVLRDPDFSISLSGLKELVKAQEVVKTGQPGEVKLKF